MGAKFSKILQEIKTRQSELVLILAVVFVFADATPDAFKATLFFGVGLCTSKEPADAIPFDILAFFLEAEKLRKNSKKNCSR